MTVDERGDLEEVRGARGPASKDHDPWLAALCVLARLHQVAASPAQLARQLALSGPSLLADLLLPRCDGGRILLLSAMQRVANQSLQER